MEFNKNNAIKELTALISLIKQDKVKSISYSAVNKWYPDLNSPVVLSEIVKPKVRLIEITLNVEFK
jgi:hypothetical protein